MVALPRKGIPKQKINRRKNKSNGGIGKNR